MERHHASAAGQRARGLPTTAGTDTQTTPGQQECPRAGDRTSRGQACGGCRRRSGSPRPQACMAGCSGRVSWRTRTRRQLLRRRPEQGNRTGPGQERKRTSAGDPADGTQHQQKRHKAAKHAEGGSQPQDLAPHLLATVLPGREPRSGLSAPSPDPHHPLQEGAAADPAPIPPASATGQAPAEGGAATTASQPPPEPERPPQEGGRGTGEKPAGSPAREGGGHGDFSQPTAHRRPTAAGKRPVQAGSPGLSTPSKPKRGRRAAGAGTASKAPAPGRHRPAATRGLFALGFTRSTTVMPSGDEGKGREPAPPRGSETPGKGRPREDLRPRARGTDGPTAKTPEPLARVLLSRRVH